MCIYVAGKFKLSLPINNTHIYLDSVNHFDIFIQTLPINSIVCIFLFEPASNALEGGSWGKKTLHVRDTIQLEKYTWIGYTTESVREALYRVSLVTSCWYS